MKNNTKISVCIPVYNGSDTIAHLVEELILKLSMYQLEIVMVNDGSKDNSEEVCTRIANQYDIVKFISLRKNFGEHNAVMCALNFATGDYIAIIDDDFQNLPSEILKLMEEAEKGYDVVYSKYDKKEHHWFRNLGSKFNDLIATWLLKKPKGLYLSSFKVLNKEVAQEIIKYKGPFPYVDGLILRVTDNISVKKVIHKERISGESNYTLGKLISLWLHMFVNFSISPLRISTVIGGSSVIFSSALGIYFFIKKLMFPEMSMGLNILIASIIFLGGIQLIFLGIVGEYLGKQYLDQNGTPQWIIKKKFGVNEDEL